jgi:hypothetical protein
MKSVRDWFLLILAIVAISAAIKYCCNNCQYKFPSYSEGHPPPTGTDPTQIFALSQDYPQTLPTEIRPWTAFNFISDPQGYAQSVLQYSLEGNIAVDFKGQNNPVRKWYHAPWLHAGENGREFRHGLTRERNSRVGELHPSQTSQVFTWAVGMLNPLGGYALGQVWPKCGGEPKPDMATSPEGTVACKLIFTTATTTEVPYIQGAFEWTANIGAIGSPRTDRTVRLLQIDIAVKDHRSPIGWVFGTFVYDGANPAPSPWDRFALVGLSWGNDPTVTSMMNTAGAYLNPSLTESYIKKPQRGETSVETNSGKMNGGAAHRKQSWSCSGALHLQGNSCHYSTDVSPRCGFLRQRMKLAQGSSPVPTIPVGSADKTHSPITTPTPPKRTPSRSNTRKYPPAAKSPKSSRKLCCAQSKSANRAFSPPCKS